MVISDGTLRALLEKGDLLCTPLGPHAVQPASLDCCLGNHFLVPQTEGKELIHIDQHISYTEVVADHFILPAKAFVLATTKEYLSVPKGISAFVEGRSSIGRMGLFIQNAGWIDPGFQGNITLELYNAADVPIKLVAGLRICQMVFCWVDKDVVLPYKGKYQGQTGAVGSRIYQDPEAQLA